MLVYIGERVRFFPDHRFHRRHHSLHLARVGDDLFGGDLFHIYNRQRYWPFSLVGDSEYLLVRQPENPALQ